MQTQRVYKKNSIRFLLLIELVVAVFLLSGCHLIVQEKNPLNPDNPVSVTLWHYYSGQTKEKFDQLVSEFNGTIGMEKGIVIDAQSQGDVKQLEIAVYDAANHKIGAQPIPDIFAAYPDSAYRVHQQVELVELEDYFSEDEISEFKQDFLDEGRFGKADSLKIVPIAKSTENLYLNKTFWEPFAKDTGADLKDLSTWEGVVRTAQAYYEWSGGKALLGIDSNSNFMLISAMQLGEEMYHYDEDTVKLNFHPKVARGIWDHFYVPYLKGYFVKTGRFSSDDAKIGTIIAYTGSTAGASYFPNEVTLSQSTVYPIESLTLPYPYFEQGRPYAVQQGAGMCITKSDLAHEYAAAEFLKWFTDVEQNVRFAVSTAYFPVKNEALKEGYLLSFIERKSETTSKMIKSSINTTVKMLNEYDLYGYKPFDGSYDMRQILEDHLFTQVKKDLESLADGAYNKEERDQKINELISDENFNKWYQDFTEKAQVYFK